MINKISNIELDTDLFLLIKDNKKAGLDKLYECYGCTLYGLAIRAGHSQEYAEEIVKLTFFKVWNHIDLFKNQKNSMCIWVIQNLILTIKEFLSSKNISYHFKTDNFPDFSFEWIE